MERIDITQILSPDLKSRLRVHDLELYLTNMDVDHVELDFSNVKFATRSFMDEFYNTFLKVQSLHPYQVEITNVPEDISRMLESVSRTQIRAKVIPPNVPEKAFANVEELLSFLATAP